MRKHLTILIKLINGILIKLINGILIKLINGIFINMTKMIRGLSGGLNTIDRVLRARNEQDLYHPNRPERNLLAAIITTAIYDIAVGDKINKRKALGFINNKKNKKPFSFNWMCQQLDLNINLTRKLILQGRCKLDTQKAW